VFYSPTPSPLALPLPLPSTPNNGASTNDLDCGQFYPRGVGGIRGGGGKKKTRPKQKKRTNERTNKQADKQTKKPRGEGGGEENKSFDIYSRDTSARFSLRELISR